MSNFSNDEWFMRSDGVPWRAFEVKRVLGDKYQSHDQYGENITCVRDPDHGQAKVKFEEDRGYLRAMKYECGRCFREDGVAYEKQTEFFVDWLKPKELVNGKWQPHQNPMDDVAKPTALAFRPDTEGNPLLYRQAIHFIYGKPGTYKSWFALSTLVDGDVKFWDFENGIVPTKSRLEALGIPRESANGYTTPTSESDVLRRVTEYRQTKPDILCIDGFAGLAAVMNINSEANNDVMRVFNQVFYPLKEAGITVLVLDHLPKDGSSDDYPIGAQAKRAQSDVSLLFKRSSKEGIVDIYLSKDRHGLLQERAELGSMPRRVAALSLVQEPNGIRVNLSPAYQAQLGKESLKSTEADTLQRVFTFVSENPGCNKGEIEKNVIGKTETKRQALSRLIVGGNIEQISVGTSFVHSTVKELDLSWIPIGSQIPAP